MRDEFAMVFEARLRAALNRSRPPRPRAETARYRTVVAHRPGFGRLMPAIAALATIALVVMAATAASGSPDPAVWTQKAVTTVKTVTSQIGSNPTSHQPDTHKAAPKSSSAPAGSKSGEGSPGSNQQSEGPEPSDRLEPAESPEPAELPEPAESPEPPDTDSSGGDGGSSYGSGG